MRKLVSFIFIICPVVFVWSQNLIPNASFEQFSGMPTGLDQFNKCDDWENAGSTAALPDYFNVNGSLLADLPVTSVAEVEPLSGNAVMGMIVCGKEGSNEREYLSVKFKNPLEIGKKYTLSFHLTNGKTYDHSLSGYGVSDIGVLMTKNSPAQVGKNPLFDTPQFKLSNEVFSRFWEEVTYTFTATDEFEFLTIGVFGNDTGKNFSFYEGNSSLAELAYYFFDDVILMEENTSPLDITHPRNEASPVLPDTELIFLPNAFTPDGDSKNDTFSAVTTSAQIFISLRVYDRWGNEIFYSKDLKLGWDGKCSGSPCPSDLYVWKVEFFTKSEEGEQITNSKTGTVHLIR